MEDARDLKLGWGLAKALAFLSPQEVKGVKVFEFSRKQFIWLKIRHDFSGHHCYFYVVVFGDLSS